MMVKYLRDHNGKTTDIQLSFQDYMRLLERANELPEYVKKGIKQGKQQVRDSKTISTEAAMAKYKKKDQP